MKRLALVLLLLASCGDATKSETPASTSTRVVTTSTTIDWLTKVREANALHETVDILEVEVSADVMRIYTSLGYVPTDATRKGMAAQICFDAQHAGWTGHIEVWGKKAGVLAWTGLSMQPCHGKD